MKVRKTLTAEQARSFARTSIGNTAIVEGTLHCGCRAYVDIFTYNRWLAQGFQVQRGEHAIHLPLIVEVDEKDEDGNTVKQKRVRGRSAVFFEIRWIRHHLEGPDAADLVAAAEYPIRDEHGYPIKTHTSR